MMSKETILILLQSMEYNMKHFILHVKQIIYKLSLYAQMLAYLFS